MNDALSVPNARRRRRVPVLHDPDPRILVAQVPWFSRIGMPSDMDDGCVRLPTWDDWPGPEVPGCLAISAQLQEFHDEVVTRTGFETLFCFVVTDVVERTRRIVPFVDGEDSWYAPNTACRSAGWCAGLVYCYGHLSRNLPDDLVEQWLWYLAGHWPAGYGDDPASGPQTLLVLRPTAGAIRDFRHYDSSMHIGGLPDDMHDQAVSLWHITGITRPWNDPGDDLRRAMAGTSSTVLACTEDDLLLGTTMVGQDGHRGWVYYLAVRPSHQHRGIGSALMEACEE